jgi:UDP-N-acetylglucosamine 2-epimerase (non-hydrolysing)
MAEITVSTHSLKLLLVAGARPNFMKVAPLIRAATAHNARCCNGEVGLECRLIHTGQHYDVQLSRIFFEELDLPQPDVNLEAGSGSHAAQTANIMLGFEPVCEQERPDWVVVVGDVNSTMACTLVASKLGIRVAHVEAGLRSFDRTMPEEINRIVTDSLADLLLTPSADANENLIREGIPEARIRLVGNIMIDSLVASLEKSNQARILERLGLQRRSFIYVTLHRPSNVDSKEPLQAVMKALTDIATQIPVVFPVHPRTRHRLSEFGLTSNGHNNLLLIDPVGYHDSLALTRSTRCVLTDSGGLQEESTFFRTPCLTLRPNTERPITTTVGSNRLTSIDRLPADLDRALQGEERLGAVPPLWDGKTAERIVQSLLDF